MPLTNEEIQTIKNALLADSLGRGEGKRFPRIRWLKTDDEHEHVAFFQISEGRKAEVERRVVDGMALCYARLDDGHLLHDEQDCIPIEMRDMPGYYEM